MLQGLGLIQAPRPNAGRKKQTYISFCKKINGRILQGFGVAQAAVTERWP